MRLYNTLTRTEEEFRPSQDNLVRMYACGLTVYSRGHIGNFRTFVAVDVLRRTLKYLEGYNSPPRDEFHGRGRSDDCRIAESGHAAPRVHESMDRRISSGCARARVGGRRRTASGHRQGNLDAMAHLVRSLEANGHTYESEGSVYFKISTLPQYGRLARLDHDGLKSGARIDSDNYDKDNARDFVLWKAAKPDEPSWNFGFGNGRPGWHLECSAMALRLLGRAADRHPLRRSRPHLPASRKRDRTKRGRDQQAVRPVLDARRTSSDRRREDVEISRQRVHPAGHSGERIPPVDAALSAPGDPLSEAAEIQLGHDGSSPRRRSGGSRTSSNGSIASRRAGSHPEIAAKVTAAESQFRAAMEQDLNTAGGARRHLRPGTCAQRRNRQQRARNR